jgi:hypothetical protein
MTFRKLLLGVAALGLASVAIAGEETHFRINSDDLGFDLQEMQQGESRSIVDESGRPILITRTADGFTFNVDGKTIELPNSSDVHAMHGTDIKMMHDMDDTMIISPKPIDAATQQAIRSLLESGGYDSDVNFIDRDSAHGRNVHIKTVKKVIESPQT